MNKKLADFFFIYRFKRIRYLSDFKQEKLRLNLQFKRFIYFHVSVCIYVVNI